MHLISSRSGYDSLDREVIACYLLFSLLARCFDNHFDPWPERIRSARHYYLPVRACEFVCEFVCAYGSIATEFRRAFCRSQWLEGRFQRIRAKRTTLVAANDNEQGPCTRWRFACTGFDPNHDPPGPIRPATETLLHATITLNAP